MVLIFIYLIINMTEDLFLWLGLFHFIFISFFISLFGIIHLGCLGPQE